MKQRCNWEHGNVMSGQRSWCGERGTQLLSLLQCTVWNLNMASRFTTVYSWPLGVNYQKMINSFMNGLRLVPNNLHHSLEQLIIV